MDQYSSWNRNLMIGIIACLLLTGIPSAMAAQRDNCPAPAAVTSPHGILT